VLLDRNDGQPAVVDRPTSKRSPDGAKRNPGLGGPTSHACGSKEAMLGTRSSISAIELGERLIILKRHLNDDV
jgi:hypothetical protein